DAFLDGRTRRVQRVLDARLLLLHLDLGRRADLDHRDAAGELRDPLLELLAIVVRRGLLDLLLQLLDAALDRGLLAAAVDDRRVFLRDADALGRAEIVELHLLERQADLLGDDLAAGEDRDVLQHRLAAIAEAGRLRRRD